tara:strand:- start:877 stop:1437 length:561 start_codon:yes stop_codon:yes gene_type:complete
MNKITKFLIYICLTFSCFFLSSCNKIRESAGVGRTIPDEYTIAKNPPLALPPDYNLLPSDEMIKKKNLNSDSDLTKEILFGLDENKNSIEAESASSIVDSILEQSGADKVSSDIRLEIDEDYNKVSSKKYAFTGDKYLRKEEILDAVAESKRIRENIFNNNNILDGDIPITTRPVKERENLLKKLF